MLAFHYQPSHVAAVGALPGRSSASSLGERCALWCEMQASEAGLPGADAIASWFAICERGGKPIGITSGNHCAAAQSAAMHAMIRPGDAQPHGFRAGAKELMEDAMAAGTWRATSAWRSGSWSPRRGDIAIYDRSDPARPETSWWGHVNRVVSVEPNGELVTLGANEGPGGAWKFGRIGPDHARLLGFVEYPHGGALMAGAFGFGLALAGIGVAAALYMGNPRGR